ncbi:MAG: hypothetical protein FJ390_03415, partial [Verrucomicrobia bacterium]|nr:hypothetical protein [Verrucomicrobiota bacterium]
MKNKVIWAVGTLSITFGIFIGFFHIHNSDVWWHIAWGEQMLQQHTIFPAADFFYFTPTTNDYLRDLPNTFLGDIGLAFLFRWGGTVALQLLVLTCLFSGAYFILTPWKNKIQENKQWVPFALLLFFAFCLGTCQLQVVRNSIVSLSLFPLTLVRYVKHTQYGGKKYLSSSVFIFLIWSWIHPSYLLGILSLLLLYGGDCIEHFLHSRSLSSVMPSFRALLALTLLFLVTLTYSWQPRQLITTTLTHTTSSLTHFLKKELHSSSSSEELSTKITEPLWGKSAAPLSGDFVPTWKVMHHPAAWSSMLLALVAWLSLFFYRGPHKLGFIGLLILTTYFGYCYLRGTGYLTIVAIFILTSVLTTMEFRSPRLATMAFRGAMILALIAIGGMM